MAPQPYVFVEVRLTKTGQESLVSLHHTAGWHPPCLLEQAQSGPSSRRHAEAGSCVILALLGIWDHAVAGRPAGRGTHKRTTVEEPCAFG